MNEAIAKRRATYQRKRLERAQRTNQQAIQVQQGQKLIQNQHRVNDLPHQHAFPDYDDIADDISSDGDFYENENNQQQHIEHVL